ncbi:KilA-N domain-containing protein [Chitinivorax sp. PXF-14]|uniref:KilA-N domain-containing protein n=1 Tax=Chitinivorax sp. PXF-14 TaxID=3230488 RepID=UPI0034657729
MSDLVQTAPLQLADIAIRQDAAGRYCLNDLHRAAISSGANQRAKEPGKFFASPQTVELVTELSDTQNLGITPVNTVKGNFSGGVQQGTYVCKELVYAYAMWISPKFHLQVIRAYDALQTAGGDAVQMMRQEIAQLRTTLSRLHGELRLYRQEQAAQLPVLLREWQGIVIRLVRVDGQAWLAQDSLAAVARSVGFVETYDLSRNPRSVLAKAGVRDEGFIRTYKIRAVMDAYRCSGVAVQLAMDSQSQFITVVSPLALTQADAALKPFTEWLWRVIGDVASLPEFLPAGVMAGGRKSSRKQLSVVK